MYRRSRRQQFTPTQRRLLNVLSDGGRHKRDELFSCVSDDFSDQKNLRKHISLLRTRLRPYGQDVICEYHQRSWWYRHVVLLTPERSFFSESARA